ncbi:hypothetical protein AB4K20DRAFT_1976224 [Rhizopus microsporus]|uniref:Uncharacterized protein n=1 Tax=Rhizopus microsporus TaxID=58291 RepID=A0A1X0RN48_RHIZD|nr:hypothetical protein BCV71DRAFT_239367 [Rhizopus microsporus]
MSTERDDPVTMTSIFMEALLKTITDSIAVLLDQLILLERHSLGTVPNLEMALAHFLILLLEVANFCLEYRKETWAQTCFLANVNSLQANLNEMSLAPLRSLGLFLSGRYLSLGKDALWRFNGINLRTTGGKRRLEKVKLDQELVRLQQKREGLSKIDYSMLLKLLQNERMNITDYQAKRLWLAKEIIEAIGENSLGCLYKNNYSNKT